MIANSSLKRPPIIPSVLTLLGIVVLFTLGAWQLSRYQDRIQAFEACAKDSAAHVSNFITLTARTPDGCTLSITGQLQSAPLIPVGPRVIDSVSGYHIHGIITGQDGATIIVNLGWSENSAPDFSAQTITATGQIITPAGSNAFTPENIPQEGTWFALDLDEVQSHLALDAAMSDKILYAQALEPEILTPFTPATLRQSYLKPETHLQYASFWIFMGFALLGIFALRFCVRQKA